jgi:hypothetical protein
MSTEEEDSVADAIREMFINWREDNRFGRWQTDLEADKTVAPLQMDLTDPVVTEEFVNFVIVELRALHEAAVILAGLIDDL